MIFLEQKIYGFYPSTKINQIKQENKINYDLHNLKIAIKSKIKVSKLCVGP